MNNSEVYSALRVATMPVVQDMGYDFWGMDYQVYRGGALLRIYIDSDDGVNVEDCARVSRRVSRVLEVEEIVPEGWRLEISSPGLDRPLFSWKQFVRYAGHPVRLKLNSPVNRQSNFTGRLEISADAKNEILIKTPEAAVRIPFESIARASLLPEI